MPEYTKKQGQYLAFIYHYTKINRRPPSEMDMQRFFGVTPPTVHQMVLKLDERGFITREPGKARTIRVLLPSEELPDLESRSHTRVLQESPPLIREWRREAYERELHRELTVLDESFTEWRSGAISSGELSHRIHEWERGPSRALFKHYNHGPQDSTVAYAIVLGILDEAEVPEELLEAISRPLAFFRSLKERDDLRGREGTWWK